MINNLKRFYKLELVGEVSLEKEQQQIATSNLRKTIYAGRLKNDVYNVRLPIRFSGPSYEKLTVVCWVDVHDKHEDLLFSMGSMSYTVYPERKVMLTPKERQQTFRDLQRTQQPLKRSMHPYIKLVNLFWYKQDGHNARPVNHSNCNPQEVTP